MADLPVGNDDLPGVVMPRTRASVVGETASLRYPHEHGRYYTIIHFVEYKRTNPKRPASRTDVSSIILPLPTNLQEYYAMQYGDVEFDKLGGTMHAADRMVNDFMSWGMLGHESLEGMKALSRRGAFFSDDLGGVIDRVTGTAVNPHITAVFRGVGLREHNLSWRMHARTREESDSIARIKDFIRERMHPEKKSSFLLDFPDEVYVRFFAEDKEFLFPIYKAVVASMDMDWSSEGTNAFFKETDAPVVVNLNMTIKEVESLTREDFRASPQASAVETATDETGLNVTNGAFGAAP